MARRISSPPSRTCTQTGDTPAGSCGPDAGGSCCKGARPARRCRKRSSSRSQRRAGLAGWSIWNPEPPRSAARVPDSSASPGGLVRRHASRSSARYTPSRSTRSVSSWTRCPQCLQVPFETLSRYSSSVAISGSSVALIGDLRSPARRGCRGGGRPERRAGRRRGGAKPVEDAVLALA
jgi:hypothetical protein